MPVDPKQRRALDQSLGRLEEALARSRASEALAARTTSAALAPARSTRSFAGQLSIPLMVLLLVILLAMGLTEARTFLIPALFTGLGLVVLLARRKASPAAALPSGSGHPHVGMGATVAADAVLHDGSVVEMGASVGAGAVLERGAVVRMGASVGPRAVLEAGATVSWGASVGEGAVVGAGAVVAAGSDVGAGVRVPAHTSMAPGTSWTAAMSGSRHVAAAPARDQLEAASDPRAEHIRKACDRLEEEYSRAPEPVRAMFGEARSTLSNLRRTCLDLLTRERALRAEASPEALSRLDQEKSAIEARLAQASDEQVRRSLSGAVTAIAAQQAQRKLLQNNADRLEAELTRLIWTMDGMGTELLRVRTAGAELYQGSTGEIAQSVQQLQDEINNIAQALEELHT
jgi:carbonic anhydrase/acetyltransferase-like protein (isoleucine patch superfamily)